MAWRAGMDQRRIAAIKGDWDGYKICVHPSRFHPHSLSTALASRCSHSFTTLKSHSVGNF